MKPGANLRVGPNKEESVVHQLQISLFMVQMITRDDHNRMIIEFNASDEQHITKLGINVSDIVNMWVSVSDEPALLININCEED